jgi:hypothetical protein
LLIASAPLSLVAVPIIVAPAAPKDKAMACPIPRLAPVTNTIFFIQNIEKKQCLSFDSVLCVYSLTKKKNIHFVLSDQ